MMNKNIEMAHKIAEQIDKIGGSTYYVGGCVRDYLLNQKCNDIDLEIHALKKSEVEAVLQSLGTLKTFGKSFVIYQLKGYDIDISLPRSQEDFSQIDPYVGAEAASNRRDFTINAMMINVLNNQLLDYHNGKKDLQTGVLRQVSSNCFIEDPLRVLRAAQFASRYNLKITEDTLKSAMNQDLSSIKKERVYPEIIKALLKSEKPSVFFYYLKEMNQLDYWFKELKGLIDVPQNSKYHQEGDVFTHTMMVIDAAAKIKDKVLYPEEFMLAALCHDFGKSITTTIKNGEIHSYQHEIKGKPLVANFIRRITDKNFICKYIVNMTYLHMRPRTVYTNNSHMKATNKLFDESLCSEDLIYLAQADAMGKLPLISDIEQQTEFLFNRFSIYQEYMSRDYVTGDDLLAEGCPQDENFKDLMELAHQLRLSGVNKAKALQQVLALNKKIHLK